MGEMQQPAAAVPERARFAPWPYVAGVLVAGLLTLVVMLLAGGGAPQPAPAGIPDAGPFTGWALPASRLLADAAAILAVGAALTAAVLLPPGAGRSLGACGTRLVRTGAVAAGCCALLAAVEIVLTYSDFLGIPVSTALAQPGLSSFVADTVQGRALLIQLLLMVGMLLAATAVGTTRGAGWMALLAFGGMAVPAFAGHSSAADAHALAVSVLVVHLVAVAAWVGGLAGVSLAARQQDVPLPETARRFSALALWCAGAVGASGAVNAWLRLGSLDQMVGSSYGLLVLCKVFALVLLCTAGYVHRQRTLPQLDTRRRPFVRLAAVEVAVMAATLGLAVALSRTPTPVTGS
ncbi:MAG: copper resistance D family protein [Streptosporangiales bacterium]